MVIIRAVYPLQWMRLMMICCGMAVKKKGMLGVSVSKMKKAPAVNIETVTLIGNNR
jgi:hypothetical protein